MDILPSTWACRLIRLSWLRSFIVKRLREVKELLLEIQKHLLSLWCLWRHCWSWVKVWCSLITLPKGRVDQDLSALIESIDVGDPRHVLLLISTSTSYLWCLLSVDSWYYMSSSIDVLRVEFSCLVGGCDTFILKVEVRCVLFLGTLFTFRGIINAQFVFYGSFFKIWSIFWSGVLGQVDVRQEGLSVRMPVLGKLFLRSLRGKVRSMLSGLHSEST